MRRKNISRSLSFLVFALFVSVTFVPLVNAAASLNPSSASGLVNMPIPFTASGLTPNGNVYIKLGTTTVATGLVPDSQGQLSFTVTPTTAGSTSVGVYNTTGDTLLCSASISVTDAFATVVPALVLLIGFSILFGISKEMGKI